jgi:hypothetical protein
MDKQQALLKPPSETSPTTSGPQALQEPVFISSQSLTQLQHTLESTQTSLEQQHKALFHTYIAHQKQKQPYLALQYANECAQFRKLAQTIQDQQFRLSRLHQRILSATTEEEQVKLRTCTSLIIQTIQGYLETTSLDIQQHIAPLIELIEAQNHVSVHQLKETSTHP